LEHKQGRSVSRAWRLLSFLAAVRKSRSSANSILLSFIAIAISGCIAVGPNFKQPSAPIAKQWKLTDDAAIKTSREEYRDWWTIFNDPALTRLVNLAYRQNLTLQIAGVRVLEARAQLGIAIGEFYPQQQAVSASVSYNRIPLSLPYILSNNTYWTDSFGAQAAWEIDLWGKLRRAIESSDDAFLASVANYDDALVTLIADVASAYVQIRTVETQIAIAKDNVARQRTALKIANSRFHYGTATKRDVYQAENVLGATEATVPQLTIQLTQARNALSVLLGIPPGQTSDVIGAASGIPTAPADVAVGIPADLLRRRPDVRRAELQAAAQCAQIGFAKADLFPSFTLLGNVGTVASNVNRASLGDVFTSSSLVFSAGPAVQWNILNYGQITNNVRLQDAKFQEAILNYQNTVLTAQQDVENGITTFVESRRQTVFLNQSVTGAEGALRIALIQYRQGIADFTTVLTAEQNLYQAQNNLALATGSIALGLIATYRALGGGWQIRDSHNFIPEQTRSEMTKRTNWGTLLTPDLSRPKAPGLPGPSDQKRPPLGVPEF
jgi:NodT family efflux transporter outer membrane factor (OMF) lipoprotein